MDHSPDRPSPFLAPRLLAGLVLVALGSLLLTACGADEASQQQVIRGTLGVAAEPALPFHAVEWRGQDSQVLAVRFLDQRDPPAWLEALSQDDEGLGLRPQVLDDGARVGFQVVSLPLGDPLDDVTVSVGGPVVKTDTEPALVLKVTSITGVQGDAGLCGIDHGAYRYQACRVGDLSVPPACCTGACCPQEKSVRGGPP